MLLSTFGCFVRSCKTRGGSSQSLDWPLPTSRLFSFTYSLAGLYAHPHPPLHILSLLILTVMTPKSPISPQTTPVEVSSKVIPDNVSYDAFVNVYLEFLEWIKTIRLVDESHPAYAIEREFLQDHTKLQK